MSVAKECARQWVLSQMMSHVQTPKGTHRMYEVTENLLATMALEFCPKKNAFGTKVFFSRKPSGHNGIGTLSKKDVFGTRV